MISDQDIQHAVDYLRDSARDAAQAKANRISIEEGRKSLKATLMIEYAHSVDRSMPLAEQERNAYSDERYRAYLDGLKEAVRQDEEFRMLRVAATAKIDAWRTFQANNRGVDRAA